MSDLLIPYALAANGDAIVVPERAFSSSDYRCPECLQRVHLRIPTDRRTHFFHVPPSSGTCLLDSRSGRGEGQVHAFAKHALFIWLHRWLSGDSIAEPVLQGQCSTHRQSFLVSLPKPQPFALHKEYLVPSGRRLDIALLDGEGRIAIGFEIRHRHAVTAKKAEGLPARWLELEAQSIVAAFQATLAGNPVAQCRVMRWSEHDTPSCCKARQALSFVGAAQFAGGKNNRDVTILPPIARLDGDDALMREAGVAASNGVTPYAFAMTYARKTSSTASSVVQRLKDFGLARSGGSWS